MRQIVVALSALTSLAVPAAAAALTWSEPISLPQGDRPLAAIPAPSGGETLTIRGYRVNDPTAPPNLTGLTVQRLSATGQAAGVPTRIAGALLIRDRPRTDGGDDLLVKLPAGRAGAGRLALVRAGADGGLRTLWRSPNLIEDVRADLARDGAGRLVIAWPHRHGAPDTAGTDAIAVVTSPDGRRFTTPRELRATRHGRPLTFASIMGIAVAVGPGGTPIVAGTEWAAGGRTIVLRARHDATVAARQSFAGATGLVATEQTSGGRVGLLVHDTGIEGEWGECVGDGRPRAVFASTAESRTGRFHSLRKLGEQQAFCPDGGAPHMITGAHDQLIVAFGAIDDRERPADVRVAWSSPGQGFGAATTIWPGTQLAGIAADPRDGALIAALQDPDPHLLGPGNLRLFGPGKGISIAFRMPDGTFVAPHRLSPSGLLTTFAAAADGRLMVGLQEPGSTASMLFAGR